VREREHDVEVREGQKVRGLLLQPLGAVEFLATGTMPVPAGVRHEVLMSAMSTLVLVAAQHWRVTGRRWRGGPSNDEPADDATGKSWAIQLAQLRPG